MNAFEQLVGDIYLNQGYWVINGYKVNLTQDEKRKIGRHSSPRWEIDILAYKGQTNEVHVVECKSFLDSKGVTIKEFQDADQKAGGRYKLFNERMLREVVFNRLRLQLHEEGFTQKDPTIHLCLAAGKIKAGEETQLKDYFQAKKWILYGPSWIHGHLKTLSRASYSDQISSIVAKLLLREQDAEQSDGV